MHNGQQGGTDQPVRIGPERVYAFCVAALASRLERSPPVAL